MHARWPRGTAGGSGWRSAAAGTGWSAGCRAPGPTCSPRCSTATWTRATQIPRGVDRRRGAGCAPGRCPTLMTEGGSRTGAPWGGYTETRVDRAVLGTRRAVFPTHGLDPERSWTDHERTGPGAVPRRRAGSRRTRAGHPDAPADPDDVAGLDAATLPIRAAPDAPTRGTGRPTSSPPTAATVHLRPIGPTTPTGVVGFYSTAAPTGPATTASSAPTRSIPARDLQRFTHGRPRRPGGASCCGWATRSSRRPLRPLPEAPTTAEVAFVVERRPPGPRARVGAARAPGRGGPRARHHAVRGRGAGREPRDGAGLPQAGYQGAALVRGRRRCT